MTCASCVALIERRVKKLPGVHEVLVGLLAEKAEVLYDPTVRSEADIISTIQRAGFQACRLHETDTSEEVVLAITGMSCASCVNTIEVSLGLLQLP